MKWFPRLILAVAVLALSVPAFGQTQVDITPSLRPTAMPALYQRLIGTAGSTTWSLDSAGVDTSVTYDVLPGTFCAVGLKLDAAADSLDQVYIDGSLDGSNWLLIDSVGAVLGTTFKIRYIHGPANGTVGAATPVIVRHLRFRADNDDGAAAATVITGFVVSSWRN